MFKVSLLKFVCTIFEIFSINFLCTQYKYYNLFKSICACK